MPYGRRNDGKAAQALAVSAGFEDGKVAQCECGCYTAPERSTDANRAPWNPSTR
jgi:hypothetical protein